MIRAPAMMIQKNAWLIALVIGYVLVPITCVVSRQVPAQAGPVNHGLRLHLAIASTRTGDQDSHRVSLSIINTGLVPITLKGWPDPGRPYADWLANSTTFTSHPHLHAHSFQIAGGSPEEQTVSLAPGATTDAQWTVIGNVFTGYDTCSYLTLPLDGLYLLRANVEVCANDKQKIYLYSNEAPCSIGGSLEAPWKCSTHIIKVAADRTITLGIGAKSDVKLGDHYLAVLDPLSHESADVRWVSLLVTAVGKYSCTAVAEPGGRLSGDNGAMPWFPEPGAQVFLQSPGPPFYPAPIQTH